MTWPAAFAPQAVRDVEGAADWLAEFGGGPDVARRMALAVVEAAQRVTVRPLLGHARPALLPAPFRFWTVRGFPYVLVYRVDRQPVRVARVLHTARDLGPLLAGLPEAADEGRPDQA